MIYYVEKNNLPKSKKKIIIDFNGCDNKEEAILLIAKKLKGKGSPNLLSGYSLDALFDVLCDFFIENWIIWNEIFIYNWASFSNKNPILSQKLLTLIIEAYIASISGTLRLIESADIRFEDSDLLMALESKKPCIYLVIN